MTVGCLGDIVFEVSADTVKTLNNFSWSGSARWSTHQRHLYDALTEFTGIDADQISFEIELNSTLGVDVQDEMKTIWEYERTGKTLPLVLGSKGYGKYRWTITQHSLTAENFDGAGNIINASVNISLQEYLKE